MNYTISGTPFPVVEVTLNAGESMNCQKGAMTWMTSNMEMSTNAGGGVKGVLGRVFSGESIFQNTYTAGKGAPGQIAFGVNSPGQIMEFDITPERSLVGQKGAYLASEPGVTFSTFFQKKLGAGIFGGEGFIMQKYSGKGKIFLEIDGSVVEKNLGPGEVLLVDTGYVAAMEATCSMDIETVSGIGNALFGGEGLFNTKVTGPGRVWLQTMPMSHIAQSIIPYIPTKN